MKALCCPLVTVYLCLISVAAARRIISIGGLFHAENNDAEVAFLNALDLVNRYHDKFELRPIVRRLDASDSFAAEKLVCGLASEGVAAIFGPSSKYTSDIVASVCNELGIPHILVHWQPDPLVPDLNTHNHTRNFFPQPSVFATALGEIIIGNEWQKTAISILYENNDNLERMYVILEQHEPTDPPVTLYQLPDDTDDYKTLLKAIQVTGANNIIFDCSQEKIERIMQQADELKILEDYERYVITSLDAHAIDYSGPKYKNANIKMIRMMQMASMDPWDMKVNVETMRTETALIYDAVQMFVTTLRELPFDVRPESMRCASSHRWDQGIKIIEHLSERTYDGITGRVIFDDNGHRTDCFLELIHLTNDGFKQIAHWDATKRLVVTRSENETTSYVSQSLQNRTIVVSARMDEPWLKWKPKQEGVYYEGNDRFEGFSLDLIDAIARDLRFQYRFELVPGNRYGSYDPVTKKWDGLVRQLLDRRADLAIGDLTITFERRQAVDFTSPFMNLGISILFSKPKKQPPDLFSFMAPLSLEVWMYMVTTYLALSILLFFIAKLAADDWENPHPCNEDPEELENIWTMHNCVWLTVGSIMQQGCDLLPKAVSTRLIVGFWWFFALIVTSSYTANLAAFLTKEQMEASIENVEDLAAQSFIKYGAVKNGATLSFFRDSNVSTYQRMYSVMEADPSVLTVSNTVGIDQVRKGKHRYAFLMESSMIEYNIERDCNLTQIGKLLDAKNYGIALPFHSPYRSLISQSVLKLQEGGQLKKLKDKWWKVSDEGQQCSDPEKSDELGMGHVGGVFLVLVVGCACGILIGILEFLWNVRNVAIEKQISQFEALKSECLFVLKMRTTKPVYAPDSSGGSMASSSSMNSLERDDTVPLEEVESQRKLHSV